MPKVGPEHVERRRRQILDGARRCFNRRGYEGATIRQIERETGLSTGAIFNYFPNKLELFLALADEDASRMAALWEKGGLEGVVRAAAGPDFELVGGFLELGRLVWKDPAFRERWNRRGAPIVRAIEEGVREGVRRGLLRKDVSEEALVSYVIVVLDGLMLEVKTVGLPANLEEVLSMAADALGSRGGFLVRSRK